LSAASPFHVLLVDDEPDELLLLHRAFTAVAPQVRVTELTSCAKVVPFLRAAGRAGAPNLVLMDLNMPGMDGHEALASIRSDPKFGNTPIIIFSATESRAAIARSYMLRANSHVAKPADYQHLKKIVASIVDYWSQTVLTPPAQPKK